MSMRANGGFPAPVEVLPQTGKHPDDRFYGTCIARIFSLVLFSRPGYYQNGFSKN